MMILLFFVSSTEDMSDIHFLYEHSHNTPMCEAWIGSILLEDIPVVNDMSKHKNFPWWLNKDTNTLVHQVSLN